VAHSFEHKLLAVCMGKSTALRPRGRTKIRIRRRPSTTKPPCSTTASRRKKLRSRPISSRSDKVESTIKPPLSRRLLPRSLGASFFAESGRIRRNCAVAARVHFCPDLRVPRLRLSRPANQRFVSLAPNSRRSLSRRSAFLRNLHEQFLGIVQAAKGRRGASCSR
jgi:hypothetical protein